jgi:hypothetical protein
VFIVDEFAVSSADLWGVYGALGCAYA